MMSGMFCHLKLLLKQQADNLYQLKSASQPTVKIWTGIENEYNYIYQKDPNTLYLIKG